MARKTKSKTARRDTIDIARDPLLRPPTILPRPIKIVTVPQFLHEVRTLDDRRRFNPTRKAAAVAALTSRAARIVPKATDKFGQQLRAFPHRQRFALPSQVTLCLRRRIRKEVLHALGKAGRSGRQRKHRRNFWSDVSC